MNKFKINKLDDTRFKILICHLDGIVEIVKHEKEKKNNKKRSTFRTKDFIKLFIEDYD